MCSQHPWPITEKSTCHFHNKIQQNDMCSQHPWPQHPSQKRAHVIFTTKYNKMTCAHNTHAIPDAGREGGEAQERKLRQMELSKNNHGKEGAQEQGKRLITKGNGGRGNRRAQKEIAVEVSWGELLKANDGRRKRWAGKETDSQISKGTEGREKKRRPGEEVRKGTKKRRSRKETTAG